MSRHAVQICHRQRREESVIETEREREKEIPREILCRHFSIIVDKGKVSKGRGNPILKFFDRIRRNKSGNIIARVYKFKCTRRIN